MRKGNLLRQIVAVLTLPFIMSVVVPALLVTGTKHGWGLDFPFSLLPIVVGVILITVGLTLLLLTVRLFQTVGQGTIAPWDPTQRLVVTGVYRHVRNPMISGVMSILVGETILFASLPLLVWTVAFITVNLIYIPLSEEPGLYERFGEDYAVYVRHVPRWIPRLTAWKPSQDEL